MAIGLQLAARTDPSWVHVLSAQKEWARAEIIPGVRYLAAGSLPNYWRNAIRARHVKGEGHLVDSCLCGRAKPSGSHLLWSCDAEKLVCLREEVAMPCTVSEERSLLRAVPPMPVVVPRPMDATVAELEKALARVSRRKILVLGTDGTSKNGHSAGCVALDDEGWAFDIPSPDASPFLAELWSLMVVLQALAACSQRGVRFGQIVIACDCKSAIKVALSSSLLPGWWSLQQQVRQAQSRVLMGSLEVEWVPSHGKRLEWSPKGKLVAPAQLRRINMVADVTAGAFGARRRRELGLDDWAEQCDGAAAWSRQALEHAAKVEQAYNDHLGIGRTLVHATPADFSA